MARRADLPGTISRHGATEQLSRHRHRHGYAAVVLSGGYTEAGDLGRHRVRAGDVLIHGPFEAHQDRFEIGGASVLNLPLHGIVQSYAGQVADPDAVVRLSERDPSAAAEYLLAAIEPSTSQCDDWPDLLAALLRVGPVCLANWAREYELAPSSVSRGFKLAYGTSPQRYGLEQRAAKAARDITAGFGLADAGFAAGFADQPHMTRTLRRLYGLTPGQLAGHVKSVQDPPAPRA